MSEEVKTPILDELEKGPWPSFVTEMKKAAAKKESAKDLLRLLERSMKDKITHWKHGGIVGVRGYGGGIIGRYCDLPDEFPGVAHFHTVRINHPAGSYYKTDKLRELLQIWDKYGSGLTNFHGSTGDIILLGTNTDALEPIFAEVSSRGWDLGGSGSALRTPNCCVGMSRCEWANIDTMNITYEMTQEFQDELHRPAFPYKFKIKSAGCAIDCIASVARADCSVIGTWRDNIRIDQDEVRNYAKNGMDIQAEVIDMCPTQCMSYSEKDGLYIDDSNCNRCMFCIARMTKALRPGEDKGATILIGSKAPFEIGATLSWVIIPFMKMEPPYDELKDFIRDAWDWWDEYGKNRERIGELIIRRGMRDFLEAVGLEPDPKMVFEPRKEPFYFWKKEDLEKPIKI
ncbi:MAG: dissimilatory-type sulfite reductase subunit alpha [Nitrospirae bacterium]|nr:MAG: dissimilatory-type sulfite reductase subunit alpha [Nitrospirota bacterium]